MTYRYLIVKYKPQAADKQPINIGVIVQSDNEIDCKFDKNVERVEKATGEKVERIIFDNLNDTFKQRFAEGSFEITDKASGQKKVIKYTSPDYFDYLSTSFLNLYYFNNRGLIEAENLQAALVRLYQNFVDPDYKE